LIDKKLAKLDEVSHLLKDLRTKLMAKEKIGKDELKKILETDYEEVISNLKEDYQSYMSK